MYSISNLMGKCSNDPDAKINIFWSVINHTPPRARCALHSNLPDTRNFLQLSFARISVIQRVCTCLTALFSPVWHPDYRKKTHCIYGRLRETTLLGAPMTSSLHGCPRLCRKRKSAKKGAEAKLHFLFRNSFLLLRMLSITLL